MLLKSLKGEAGKLKPNAEDRITKYLSMLNKGMLFDELSEDYLEKAGVKDILTGVPVPVLPGEDGELTTLSIMLNMAKIIGGDSNYPYLEQYIDYIKFVADDDPEPVLLSFGAKEADAGNYESACMLFRAILLIFPKSRDALYLYGRACKGAYEQENLDEEYVGNFKAESLEAFELLTMMHKEFDMGYYFLGYSYANLGLYTKAKITWESFIELHQLDDELREEINERIELLEEPIIIEQACNRINAGDYQGGKDTLEPYTEGRYEKWWPLYYHLGIAEEGLGNVDAAIKRFKEALALTPSNTELMQELVKLYNSIGDKENVEKYEKKISIISKNIESERNEYS